MQKSLLSYILIFSFSCFYQLYAQQLNFSNISIYRDGNLLKLSNAGGFNAPQYSAIDLNNDGIKDLLVYERSSETALTFINNGMPNTIDYTFAPEYMNRFPQGTPNFMLARDYNCDGIEDLFYFAYTEAGLYGIQVLKGGYGIDNKIEFTLAKELLQYDFRQFLNSYIFLYNPDIPAIEDIDGDGDLDIVAFTLDVAFDRNVFFYKNMSMENGYNCDSLKFQLHHQCFGMFTETDLNNTVIYSASPSTCPNNPYWRHVGSTLSAFDHNGDGTIDLLMGDVSVNSLNLLTLTAINDTLVVTNQDANFPSYNTPVDIFTFPAAYFLDANNDGKTDMIAACNSVAFGENVTDSTSWLYLNNSASAAADFSLHSKGFFYEDMLDFGLESRPSFVDLDKDGLLDIVVANSYNAQNNNTHYASLYWLKNTGTAALPAYTLVNDNLANIRNLNTLGLHATFADMDNDGWADMLIGSNNGKLIYYRNLGILVNGQPSFEQVTNVFDQISANALGTSLSPQFYDFDNDGDYDLVVGESSGNLNYFINTGNNNSFSFSSMPNSQQFGNISLNIFQARYSIPHFYKDPIDQSTKLILGNDMGKMLYYNTIDNNLEGSFALVDSNYLNIHLGKKNAFAIADINNDNILDIVIGTVRGGLTFYTSITDDTTGVELQELNTYAKPFSVYPNPSHGYISIDFEKEVEEKSRINIYNALGQNIYNNTILPFSKTYTLNLQHLNEGIYYLQVQNKTINYTISIYHKP